ncbi:MAG: peptidoglycan recognition protein family protein, partial [Candidatus Saccharimonadales bacterium]
GRGLSVQFGITNDGQIYQMMTKETSWAAQATGGNDTTFGIEIEGTGDASGLPDFGANGPTTNPKKFAAVVHLVTYLVKKYHLPLTGHLVCNDVVGVHPHKDYNTICPQYGNPGKLDIDDAYFNAVMAAVKQQPGIQ